MNFKYKWPFSSNKYWLNTNLSYLDGATFFKSTLVSSISNVRSDIIARIQFMINIKLILCAIKNIEVIWNFKYYLEINKLTNETREQKTIATK